uniref:Retrotransposon protein, putative, Ty1-copia subclass n=1 Tax=Tanacetum cinerariifolium TaxID=118510 RepID=A0A699HAU4_TANCI|nr:retrotransposon protein, putative, Ty1-copia subclass [Tanacetum cinerariifolium]
MSRHICYQKITRSFNPCIEDLPKNVMADIISRLPVTKIIHFKSVCRNWHEIVPDSYFIDLHLSRSPRCIMIHRKIQPDLVSEDEDETGNLERPCVLKCLEIEGVLDISHLHHAIVTSLDLNDTPIFKNTKIIQMELELTVRVMNLRNLGVKIKRAQKVILILVAMQRSEVTEFSGLQPSRRVTYGSDLTLLTYSMHSGLSKAFSSLPICSAQRARRQRDPGFMKKEETETYQTHISKECVYYLTLMNFPFRESFEAAKLRSATLSKLKSAILSAIRSTDPLLITSSLPSPATIVKNQKRRNITMAMISTFTTVDKTAHNSRKFAFTISPTNYGYWKTMIEPFLITNSLMGYVDGSIPCPSKTLSVTDGATVPKENPNYPIWVSNDAHVQYADALAVIDETVKDKDLVMLVVLDTGANSHVTPNLEAMDNSEAYYGDDALHVGNGGVYTHHSSHRPHEQNGFVKRRNRQVVESGLTLFAQACVPQRFWHYAFDTVVNLINRMPSRTSTNKSPFEHIFKRSLDYSFLRVFGCLCFPHLRPYNRHKMDFRSTPCVFLGYSPTFRQQPSVDFQETFSPVIKSTAIRAVLSLAVTNDRLLRQLDIQNAFLYGNLKEQVYMKQPPGFIDPQQPNYVCLLHKSLYGLKQTLCAWFERLTKALFDLGFKGSKTDPPLFIYSREDTLLYILVYVDDIIVTVEQGMLICHSSGSTLQAFTDMLWKGNPNTSLEAFSYADWAGDSDDRRSTRGFAIYLGLNLKSCTARKQRTVSRSSTEAEYKALADTVAELTWLQTLLNELGILSSSTPVLWCDNLGATYLSANPIFHARTKHVEIDSYFVWEKVAQGYLRVQHISTHDQIAYIFTNPLPTPRFLFLRSKLQVVARL